MLIDWFTVGAQAINFLILVWLLKRFLYKPVLDAIDSREARIATELADADVRKADARREYEEFRNRNAEFDQHRVAMLNQAEEDARRERQRLMETVREEADELRRRRKEELAREEQSLFRELRQRTQEEVFSIARNVLRDLAGATLEEQIAAVLVRRLLTLSDEEQTALREAMNGSSGRIVVRSAFALPTAQRQAIQQAFQQVLSCPAEFQFESSPSSISGIELLCDGHKVAWSISDYLSALERSVGELLQKESQPDAVSQQNTLVVRPDFGAASR